MQPSLGSLGNGTLTALHKHQLINEEQNELERIATIETGLCVAPTTCKSIISQPTRETTNGRISS